MARGITVHLSGTNGLALCGADVALPERKTRNPYRVSCQACAAHADHVWNVDESAGLVTVTLTRAQINALLGAAEVAGEDAPDEYAEPLDAAVAALRAGLEQ